MQQNRYVLSSPRGLILETDSADKLIKSGDGTAALLYIYILRSGGVIQPENAMAELNLSALQFSAAEAKLGELGLIAGDPVAPRTPEPEYGADDIADCLKSDDNFKALADEAERRFGRALSRADLERLLYMYDHLGLPAEVLALLITHCIEEYRARYGEGAVPRISYIEKAAAEWAQLGLKNPALAESHLKTKERLREETALAARAIGISGRKLSKSEEKYITGWLENGFSVEALERAYDTTVLKTGSLAWNYMNSILRNWHKKNLHTVEEIEQSEKNYRKSADLAAPGKDSHEQQAIEWMKEYTRRKRENGGEHDDDGSEAAPPRAGQAQCKAQGK